MSDREVQLRLLRDTTHDERSYPEDQVHENGWYYNTCIHCLRQFSGHKRRGICKVCSAPSSVTPQTRWNADFFDPASLPKSEKQPELPGLDT